MIIEDGKDALVFLSNEWSKDGKVSLMTPRDIEAKLNVYQLTQLKAHINILIEKRTNELTERRTSSGGKITG